MSRRIGVEVAGWCVALTVLWTVLVSTVDVPELLAGGLVALAAALTAAPVRRAQGVRLAPDVPSARGVGAALAHVVSDTVRLLTWLPAVAVGGRELTGGWERRRTAPPHGGARLTRRVTAVFGTTAAPLSYVADVEGGPDGDAEAGEPETLLVHRLRIRRAGGRP